MIYPYWNISLSNGIFSDSKEKRDLHVLLRKKISKFKRVKTQTVCGMLPT